MYYKRSAWTNSPNNSPFFKGPQTSITWHYPGFGNSSIKTAGWSLQRCFNQYNTWEKQHQARGSKNIEYNFGVTPTGDVVELRGFRQSGANGNSAANRYSISVQILIGDNESLNPKFLKGIVEVLKLIKQHQPKALDTFYPHKHWVKTRCPGPAIEAALKNGTINKNMAGSILVPSAGTSAPKPVNTPAPKPSSTSAGVYEVTATVLNYRQGAGTNFKVLGSVKKGEKYTITEIKNGWGKLKSGAGWVSMNYMKPVKVATKATPAPSKPAVKPEVSKTPAFPLPNGFYYGPSTGPVQSVSGKSKNSKTSDVVKDANGRYYSKGLKQWQAQMKKRGWNIGVDGRYGNETERVVKQFQHNKKLTVNGKIDPSTWNAAWNLKVI